ncbi:protein kinase [bacterium]
MFDIKKIISQITLLVFFTTILNNFTYSQNIAKPIDFFTIPEKYGQIIESYTGKGSDQVICIQDLHCNEQAQRNIAEIINITQKHFQNDCKIIGMEGSFGQIDTSIIGAIPNQRIKQNIINTYLKSGDLSGAEIYNINNPDKVVLQGIEDKDMYFYNFEKLYKSIINRQKITDIGKKIRAGLNIGKQYIYPENLKEFEKKQEALSDKLSLEAYIKYLKQMSEKYKIPFTRTYPQLANYLKINEILKKIDFEILGHETQSIINQIKDIISQKEFENLAKYSKTDSIDYYKYLKSLLAKHNIRLNSNMTNAQKYLQYLEYKEKFNSLELLAEKSNLETNLEKEIIKDFSDAEKINYCLRGLDLYEKYIANKASVYDVEKWTITKNRFFEILDELGNRLFLENYYQNNKDFFHDAEKDMKEFYYAANKRNEILVTNLLKKTKSCKVKVIVVGGYHAKGISEILKNRGTSYKIIIPNIEGEYDENLYIKKAIEQAEMLNKNRIISIKQLDTKITSAVKLLSIFEKGLALDIEQITNDIQTQVQDIYKDEKTAELPNELKTFAETYNAKTGKNYKINFEVIDGEIRVKINTKTDINLLNLLQGKRQSPAKQITIMQDRSHFYFENPTQNKEYYIVGDCGLYALSRAMLKANTQAPDLSYRFDKSIIQEMRDVLAVVAGNDTYLSRNGRKFLDSTSLGKLAMILGYELTVQDTEASQQAIIEAVEPPTERIKPDGITEEEWKLIQESEKKILEKEQKQLWEQFIPIEQPLTNEIRQKISNYDERQVEYTKIVDAFRIQKLEEKAKAEVEKEEVKEEEQKYPFDPYDTFGASIVRLGPEQKPKPLYMQQPLVFIDEKEISVPKLAQLDFTKPFEIGGYTIEPERDKEQKEVKLGEGGYGTVYAFQDAKDAKYALKIVKAEDPDEVKSVQNEINITKNLPKDNISEILASGYSINSDNVVEFYILMPRYLSFKDVIKKGYFNKPNNIINELITGLALLHKNNIFHRDIKPDNIMFKEVTNPDETITLIPLLSDFGISKTISPIPIPSFGGSTLYMAPELMNPPKKLESKTSKPATNDENSQELILGKADIWSLGITISTLLLTLQKRKKAPKEIEEEGTIPSPLFFLLDSNKRLDYEEKEDFGDYMLSAPKTVSIKKRGKNEEDPNTQFDTAIEYFIKSIDFNRFENGERIKNLVEQMLTIGYNERPNAEELLVLAGSTGIRRTSLMRTLKPILIPNSEIHVTHDTVDTFVKLNLENGITGIGKFFSSPIIILLSFFLIANIIMVSFGALSVPLFIILSILAITAMGITKNFKTLIDKIFPVMTIPPEVKIIKKAIELAAINKASADTVDSKELLNLLEKFRDSVEAEFVKLKKRYPVQAFTNILNQPNYKTIKTLIEKISSDITFLQKIKSGGLTLPSEQKLMQQALENLGKEFPNIKTDELLKAFPNARDEYARIQKELIGMIQVQIDLSQMDSINTEYIDNNISRLIQTLQAATNLSENAIKKKMTVILLGNLKKEAPLPDEIFNKNYKVVDTKRSSYTYIIGARLGLARKEIETYITGLGGVVFSTSVAEPRKLKINGNQQIAIDILPFKEISRINLVSAIRKLYNNFNTNENIRGLATITYGIDTQVFRNLELLIMQGKPFELVRKELTELEDKNIISTSFKSIVTAA